MNLFLGSKRNKAEDNQLTQLFSICEFIQDITYQKLNDVSEDIFKKNCEIACFSGGE